MVTQLKHANAWSFESILPVAFDVTLAEGTMSSPVVTFTPVCFCMVFSFANSNVLLVSGDGGSF
jgi:hypothetical protein